MCQPDTLKSQTPKIKAYTININYLQTIIRITLGQQWDDIINLHEHLSEFSYGNGVTREVENLLVPIGLATPFYHQLSSLNDVHYRRRRKTCSRLDGYAFIHPESTPPRAL